MDKPIRLFEASSCIEEFADFRDVKFHWYKVNSNFENIDYCDLIEDYNNPYPPVGIQFDHQCDLLRFDRNDLRVSFR
jgi:hypothetical protein